MSGSDKPMPIPTRIVVHRQSKIFEIEFGDGALHKFTFEFLRVNSPSAEVRGHGPGQETLQTGKRDVDIVEIEPVGNYAVQPTFSDGHSSGIYSWDYLHWLGEQKEQLWNEYLLLLQEAGASRDPEGAPSEPGMAAQAVSRPKN